MARKSQKHAGKLLPAIQKFLGRLSLVLLAGAAFSCRSNPFGDTQKSLEEFQIYTTDFAAQNDGGMKSALLEVIEGAKVRLNCAFSTLTLIEVTNALIARASAGVQVRIAFDADVRESDSGSLLLQASGVFAPGDTPTETKQSQLFYGNLGSANMRHNYCLADERYVYISTAPPDDTLMRKAPGIAFKIGGAEHGITRDFLRESNMFSQLLFGNGKAKTDFTTKFTALNQVISAYWGPQEKPLDVLASDLSEATASVEFYSTAFQTTNSYNPDLDIPQVLFVLETAKGLAVKKYFSSQALFDPASKAHTFVNPARYTNSSVAIGTNILIVDRALNSAKVFIYTGALRTQANSSDDSVLLELRGKFAAGLVGAYLDKIGAATQVVSNSGDTGYAGAIVISEIHWMGSQSDSLAGDSADEFIEFYNTTPNTLNISGWKFACTANGGTTVNSYFTLPAGATIAPGGFFVVANKNSGAFLNSDFTDAAVSVTNNASQCRLTNGKATPASSYAGQAVMTGDIIDTAGDGLTPFDGSGGALGTNNAATKTKRSMERRMPVAAGDRLSSWQSNNNSVSENNGVGAQYRQNTFASPGWAGSASAVTPLITLANPSFESDTNACTVTARDAFNNVTALTGTCPVGWTISISSANGITFSAVQGMAGSGANYATISAFTSSYAAREIRSTTCLALNKSNALAVSGMYLKDSTNSTQLRHLVYYYTDAACTALATGGANPTVLTGQSISAQNIWETKTNQVTPGSYPTEPTLYIRLGVQAQRASGGVIQFDSITLSN